jgi:hypothetical protein
MLQTPASPPSTASEPKSPIPGTRERKGTDGWDTEEWGSLEEDPVLDQWEGIEHFTRANVHQQKNNRGKLDSKDRY